MASNAHDSCFLKGWEKARKAAADEMYYAVVQFNGFVMQSFLQGMFLMFAGVVSLFLVWRFSDERDLTTLFIVYCGICCLLSCSISGIIGLVSSYSDTKNRFITMCQYGAALSSADPKVQESAAEFWIKKMQDRPIPTGDDDFKRQNLG